MSSTDEHFMDQAIAESMFSLEKDLLPVGAVAVCNGEIVARAHKEGNGASYHDHAEQNLVRDKLVDGCNIKSLRGFTVYTTLEPCSICLGLMVGFRVMRIVYGIDDPYGGGVCLLDHNVLPPRHKRDYPGITGGVRTGVIRHNFRHFFKETKQEMWQNPKNELVMMCLQAA